MFIDSDYNGKGFDASFGEDYSNHPGFLGNIFGSSGSSGSSSCSKSNPCDIGTEGERDMATKYGTNPNYTAQSLRPGCATSGSMFTNVFYPNCKTWRNMTEAERDVEAKKVNSFDYTWQQMSHEIKDATITSNIAQAVGVHSNMSCPEYDAANIALNGLIQTWNANPVTHPYDRDLRSKYLTALNNEQAAVIGYMDARDCTGSTSAIDTAQNQAAAAAAAEAAALEEALRAENDAKTAAATAAAHLSQTEAENKAKLAQAAAEKQAEIDAMNDQAARTKEENDKRNKMIMFGAGAIILLLIIKGKK